MKKSLYLFMAIVIFLLTACSEESTTPTTKKTYPSTWPKPGIIQDIYSNENDSIIGDFTFTSADGDTISFYDYTEGKFTLISLSRPTCGFCAIQMPAMQEASISKENWRVIEIYSSGNLGRTLEEERLYLQGYLSDKAYTFLYLIPEYPVKYQAIHEHFPFVSGVPANYILDKNHKLITRNIAARTIDALLNQLDDIESKYE